MSITDTTCRSCVLLEDRNNPMGRWEKVLYPLWLCGSHTDTEPQLSELTEMLFPSAGEDLGCPELTRLMPAWAVSHLNQPHCSSVGTKGALVSSASLIWDSTDHRIIMVGRNLQDHPVLPSPSTSAITPSASRCLLSTSMVTPQIPWAAHPNA